LWVRLRLRRAHRLLFWLRLRLWSHHLRFWLRLRSRLRLWLRTHHLWSWLRLRSRLPRGLRLQHLLLLRMPSLHLILPLLLTGSLHLLLCGRALLLLRLNCLRSLGCSLRLLLLPLRLLLVLRTSRLRHPLALRLHARARQCCSGCRVHLLFAQFLHLLTRVAVSMSCLFRQVRHLPLAGLFGSNVC
jgi:hypothetical protein